MGMVEDSFHKPKPRLLEDVNSRLFFYNELLDLWRSGFEIVKRSFNQSPNKVDQRKMNTLEAGIALLEIERDLAANYDQKAMKLRDVISSIPRMKREESKNETKDDKTVSPSPNQKEPPKESAGGESARA